MVSTNHVFSGFAFIGFIIVSTLLPLHIKAGNIGTCAFIVWTGVLCFNGFVNSIIWDKNVTNWAPVWCDISSRLMLGGTIAIPSACLCIARHLYHVTKNIFANQRVQGQSILFDYLLVLGIPALIVIFSYVIQVNRFYIFEEIGCYYAIGSTVLTYPLIWVWLTLIALITVIYAGATVRTLIQRRSRFKELIQRHEHVRRLLALVIMIFMCSFPPSLWLLVSDIANNPIYSWRSWEFEHANISEIVQITANTWQASGSQSVAVLQFTRWAYVMYAAIFFAFFGFTAGAKNHYRLAVGLLVKGTQETRFV
ncbi:hypothetical protein SERLA73DRAFT_50345 [Serpula lacrymans var. lacrymans S7.3]|uniref:Fungal pheromone STE3G-protein-coupled receptor n=1 Tax=Serpula lacrymans var. lacrymans (strain S7.3) TaxID=936435 RepID=F8PT71_SERL3|nr:hypothetical protein SERLA73DRAFT_50345 [Serpula lacrymans var. lacrymans S7.3]